MVNDLRLITLIVLCVSLLTTLPSAENTVVALIGCVAITHAGDDELRHDGRSARQPGEDGAGKAGHPRKPYPQAGHGAVAGLRGHGE